MEFHVYTADGQDFGIYEAESAEEAVLACIQEAGYESVREMLDDVGDEECEIFAITVTADPKLDEQIEDARQRVGAWKARREGNIDDPMAAAVYALDERYPAGWNLDTFNACLAMIEEGVSPTLAADEA